MSENDSQDDRGLETMVMSVVIELRQAGKRFYWYRPFDAMRTKFYYSKVEALADKENGNLQFNFAVNLNVQVCSF